jgi:hypothetical protein
MKFFSDLKLKNKQNKVISFVFIVVAAVIVGFAVYRIFFMGADQPVIRAKTVIPAFGKKKSGKVNSDVVLSDNGTITTFIPLKANETLLSALTLDFDGDTFDDQIVAIRKLESPYIFLIIGLYNPESNTYSRSIEISTGISRVKTFSYTGMDITGDHRNTLVYQGVRDDGSSVMRLYLCQRKQGRVNLQIIGDFQSDGTIFIQQSDRSESYELSQSKGTSFPVWVYGSDQNTQSGQESTVMSQIQTEYEWNEHTQKFLQTKQIRLAGSRIASKELSRIQNGTVATFSAFLNGLWYKTSNEGNGIRYLYFDDDAKEIIFLYQDTEEVYSWEASNLRRSGIYLTSVNASITSMQRRFDITLTGVDEIQTHVIDDVSMLIKEGSLWDGSYKKMMSGGSLEQKTDSIPVTDQFAIQLQNGPSWVFNNSWHFTFSDGKYMLKNDQTEDSGAFVIDIVGGIPVIQFRSSTGAVILSAAYRMEFAPVHVPAAGKKKAFTTSNPDVMTLTPVKISPVSCEEGVGTVLTLIRESPSLDKKQ